MDEPAKKNGIQILVLSIYNFSHAKARYPIGLIVKKIRHLPSFNPCISNVLRLL